MDKLPDYVLAFFEKLREAGPVLSFFAGVVLTLFCVWYYRDRLIPQSDAEKELAKRNEELVKKNETKDEENRKGCRHSLPGITRPFRNNTCRRWT